MRVFESRLLLRTFAPNRGEVTGEWRRLHKEELYDLYCRPNIIRVIKSKRIRWVGHVTLCGRQERCVQGFGGET
jgi:hypothetical protein